MLFLPASILGMWFRGLVSLAIIVGGVWLVARWSDKLPTEETWRETVNADDPSQSSPVPREVERVRPLQTFSERVSAWRPGWDEPTLLLVLGALLALTAIGGRVILPTRMFRRPAVDEPTAFREGETLQLTRPDGTRLHLEMYGSKANPRLILTHGWGNDSEIWYDAKREWSQEFRVIVWDLPGHGLSDPAQNRDYSTPRLADDLRAVIHATGDGPVTLVGHSLGGMTVLTFCKLFPKMLPSTISRIVLVHTTPTNPLRTTSMAGLYTALESPLIKPLLHLTKWLWPIVWGMNWLSYWNGSAHRSTARQSFAGTESRGRLDRAARYTVKTSPAVLARGGLGMLEYDATDILNQLSIPVCVIGGDKDTVTLPSASEWIAREIRGSQLHLLSPARHLGFFEHPTEFKQMALSPVPVDRRYFP